jgi:hypothetical protein
MMLSQSEIELLRRSEIEIDEQMKNSPRLKALLRQMQKAANAANGDLAMDEER